MRSAMPNGHQNGWSKGTSFERDRVGLLWFGRMLVSVVGFHRDEEGAWVAELSCGHGQHVRHDPPWQLREWVTTESGRRAKLGASLDCPYCDTAAVPS